MEDRMLKVVLGGVSPLLQSNSMLALKRLPITNAYIALKSKRERTDTENSQIDDLEWESRLYHIKGLGVVCPSLFVVHALMKAGARYKLKAAFRNSLLVVPRDIPILDTGAPKTLAKLKQRRHEFWDQRPVCVGPLLLHRTRPCFRNWKLEFALTWSGSKITMKDVVRCLFDGQFVGIGEAVAVGMGRYEVLSVSGSAEATKEFDKLRQQYLETGGQRSAA